MRLNQAKIIKKIGECILAFMSKIRNTGILSLYLAQLVDAQPKN